MPSLDWDVGEYNAVRDAIPCFLDNEKQAISIETELGTHQANEYRAILDIRDTLKSLFLRTIFIKFKRQKRLMDMRDLSDDDRAIKLAEIIEAHKALAAHIKATKFEDYEAAREARVTKFKAEVSRIGVKRMAPAGEGHCNP